MQSQAQRAYLHIHHPEIAAEFERHTPKGKKLPKHKRKKKADDEAAERVKRAFESTAAAFAPVFPMTPAELGRLLASRRSR